jgi:hypothetical protein
MKRVYFSSLVGFWILFISCINLCNVLAQKNMIVLTMDTGATIDIYGISSIYPDYQISIDSDRATWTILFNELFRKRTNYCSVGNHTNDYDYNLALIFTVSSDGIIEIRTQSVIKDEHLLVLATSNSLHNYNHFDGSKSNKNEYIEAHGWWDADYHRNNYLAYEAGRLYSDLFTYGLVKSGPKNFTEIYNSNIVLTNHFSETISVLKSSIYHQQFDYSWYDEKNRPIHEKINSLWSPIAKTPNQNIMLSRSFNMNIQNNSGVAAFIKTATDNGMYAETRLFGVENMSDFAKAGGSGRTWEAVGDSKKKLCYVRNDNCSGSSFSLIGSYPEKVEMEIYSTWSSAQTQIAVASFGSIIAFNFQEAPNPGDDKNPQPILFQIPSEKDANSFSYLPAKTRLTKREVSQLYVSIFGRASEGEGNAYWQSWPDMVSAANDMLRTDAAENYFGANLNTNQSFIEHIYLNTLNKTISDDFDGISYWVNMLDTGTTRGQAVVKLVDAINDYAPGGPYYDPDDIATVVAYNQFTHRVEISNYMADNVYTTPNDWETSTSFSHGLIVTDDPATFFAATAIVESLSSESGDTADLLDVSGNWQYRAKYAGCDTEATGAVMITLDRCTFSGQNWHHNCSVSDGYYESVAFSVSSRENRSGFQAALEKVYDQYYGAGSFAVLITKYTTDRIDIEFQDKRDGSLELMTLIRKK